MGRLAVVLGSSGLGPGGEDVAATAAGHGATVIQRHGSADAYILPHLIDHRANLLAVAEGGCDRVLAIASVGSLHAELAAGSLVCPDDFIALQLGLTVLDDVRGTPAAGLRPRTGARACSRRGAQAGRRARDGGVYWQTIGPALRDPGRDPADGRARRPGRDDDRRRVHPRRRARPRLRRGLRRRQPRQRPRDRAARRSRSSRPSRGREPRRAARATSTRCCPRWPGAGGRRASTVTDASSTARPWGSAAWTGTIAALGPERRAAARRRDDRRGGRAAGPGRWSTGTPTPR